MAKLKGELLWVQQIATLIDMADEEIVHEKLLNLVELEEDQFVVGFHQQV